ncbi:MAG: zinc/manganese transporter permease [Candidatus Muproteobacteria bacterium RBG_16_64_10]|uniref:Zinc/manganese transporter permease n=1 Tax=Candidatus Muproteobacteria bacterium RBG_16_64_10 TaxID=1817757 RepID=A0A1F6T739_9PROT|nr:MAG: zinc/manganese transporter permease [Candidatus Muproteobacteria bacterium RBG_16_64_10]
MNLDILNPAILLPALVAGLLVVSTHVPLGQEVLKRGIVFIDIAVAQIAGLGVIAAYALGWTPQGIGVQLAAAGAALLGALVLSWCEKRWPQTQEALIGAVFVLAASAGVLLLSNDPHAGEQLKELLVGQILWVSVPMLTTVSMVYAGVLALWFMLRQRFGRMGFYVLFAISVTASVQLVGVYLVFASLIIPALATREMTGPKKLMVGYAIGVGGYVAGIAASALFDLPTGAITVWTLALAAIVAASITARRT